MARYRLRNKPKEEYVTEADLLLRRRVESSYKSYSRLKLSMAHFHWGGEGVEKRARKKILKWAREFAAECQADARQAQVPSGRYLRNVLPLLSPWVSSLLLAVLRHKAISVTALPGLRLGLIRVDCRDDRTHLFDLILKEHPCSPADILPFVSLTGTSLEKAWIRWLERWGNRSEAVAELLRSSGSWIERPTRLAAIFEASGVTLAGPARAADSDTEVASKYVGPELPKLTWLVREADQRTVNPRGTPLEVAPPVLQPLLPLLEASFQSESIDPRVVHDVIEAVAEDRRLARWTDGWLSLALRGYHLREWPKSASVVSGVIPKLAWLQYLALLVANREQAILILNRLSRRHLQAVLSIMGQPNRLMLMRCLWEELVDRGVPQLRLAVGRQIVDALPSRVDPDTASLLLTRPGFLSADRREWLRGVISGFSGSQFTEFCVASKRLDDCWSAVPKLFREEILDLWLRSRPPRAQFPNISACILLDAARWGGDHGALAGALVGYAPELAIPLVKQWVSPKKREDWRVFVRRLSALRPLPSRTLRVVGRDGRLLAGLAKSGLPCFQGVPLRGLDVAILLPYALRYRWLAAAIEKQFSRKKIGQALKQLKPSFRRQPRQWASLELAGAIGFRHATTLAFLSTRPFPKVPGARFDGMYHTWALPKRKGGNRLITAPQPFLKSLQRSLLSEMLADAPLHPAATGFRTGHSIVDNARPHVGQRVVVNVDIASFFPNTKFARVARAIERVVPAGLSTETRRLVIDLCCYNGALPTGAPTSPAIANLVLRQADHAIATVASRNDIVYTRYADDLTFSGTSPVGILPFVRDVLSELGYELDRKKTNIFRRGRRQVVTSLVVNDKVSVPRRVRRKLRAAVDRATKGKELAWHGKPMNTSELEGRLAFLNMVHPEEAQRLIAQLERAGAADAS